MGIGESRMANMTIALKEIEDATGIVINGMETIPNEIERIARIAGFREIYGDELLYELISELRDFVLNNCTNHKFLLHKCGIKKDEDICVKCNLHRLRDNK